MKASELIERLQKLDPDAIIFVGDSEYGTEPVRDTGSVQYYFKHGNTYTVPGELYSSDISRERVKNEVLLDGLELYS